MLDTATAEVAPVTTPTGLLSLAPETIRYMLAFLPPEAIAAVGQTCRKLRASAKDNAFWEKELHQFSLARYKQLKAQQPQSADAPSDANDPPDSHSGINYRAEFISLWLLVNDETSYKRLDSAEKDFFIQVKKGELPSIVETENSDTDAAAASSSTSGMTTEQLIKLLKTKDSNKLTPIDWAVRLGYQHLLDAWYQKIVKLYLTDDGQPDFEKELTVNNQQYHLLYWVIKFNQANVVNDIICAENCNAILLLAAEYGRITIVKQALEQPECNIRATYSNDQTALHLAAKVDIVKELLERDPDLLYALDEDRCTALHAAASCDRVNVIKELLKHDPDLLYKVDFVGETALHAAAYSGSANAIKELLKHDSRLIYATDKYGATALHTAAKGEAVGDYLSTIKALLEHIENPGEKARFLYTTDQDGATALHLLVAGGGDDQVDIVKELLKHGSRLIYTTDQNGATALDIAKMSANRHYYNQNMVDILTWHQIAMARSEATPLEQAIAIAQSLIPSNGESAAAKIQLPGTSDPFSNLHTQFPDITADNEEDAANAIVEIVTAHQPTTTESADAADNVVRMANLKDYIVRVLFEPHRKLIDSWLEASPPEPESESQRKRSAQGDADSDDDRAYKRPRT